MSGWCWGLNVCTAYANEESVPRYTFLFKLFKSMLLVLTFIITKVPFFKQLLYNSLSSYPLLEALYAIFGTPELIEHLQFSKIPKKTPLSLARLHIYSFNDKSTVKLDWSKNKPANTLQWHYSTHIFKPLWLTFLSRASLLKLGGMGG